MISLDEEYIGMDANSIIVRALKVCSGVFCKLNSGNLLAAHFSSTVTPEEILVGCRYLMRHFSANSNVTEMYFIANLEQWQRRDDKYSNTITLVQELKLMFQYTGAVKVGDKNMFGQSVDIRFDTGNPASISYRLTMPNDPLIVTPSNDVKYIKHQSIGGARTRTPIVIPTNVPHFHQLPTTQNGFTAFTPSMFVPVN